MWNEPHTTISILLDHVDAWHKREGWSRETVCQQIVDVHDKSLGPSTTGITFNPPSQDAFTRQKANAERIYRWLDDKTKDNNLLPTNFIRTIITALPADLRLSCLNRFLNPFGMHAELGYGNVCNLGFNPLAHVQAMTKEGGEAVIAMAEVGTGASIDKLESAIKEINEDIFTKQNALRDVENQLNKLKGKV